MKSLGLLSLISALVVSAPGWAQQLAPLLQDRLYLKVDNATSTQVIETEDIRKLYQANGMANFWINGAKPNEAAHALAQILRSADQYGLNPAHYWNASLENLYHKMTDRNAITFELMLSDAYFRFARDLSNGQVLDPDLIDEDIKMVKKTFDQHNDLVQASKSPQSLRTHIESLAPQHNSYKKLLQVLSTFKRLKAENAWGELIDPGGDIKPGQSHKTIPEIKKRLNNLGYGLPTNRTTVFDSELQAAVKKYQELNRIPVIKNISRSFYASLGLDLETRIERVKANLEKYRWFPRHWEDRYLMVNLAFQEMNVVEHNQAVLKMKTVNGRPTRRTPTLRDEIRFIELNPTWTVPFSIAVKDKLPQLQENPYSLESQNIWVYDRHGNHLNPATVDWYSYNRSNFNFTLVQQPGAYNALGLVKFPLTNPWFIYLHDTSEHYLMKESNRLKSSGCVRLERAFDLVQYLLKDQPEWPLSRVRAQKQPQMRINVKKLPVYFMYQTVDMTDSGEIRMAADDYGQDQRLIELFKSRGSLEKF